MVGVMGIASVNAEDAGQNRNGMMGWLRKQTPPASRQQVRSGAPIRHAVVADAARQAPEIRQTSNEPQPAQPQPGTVPLQPLPIQYTPPVPNASAESGPQYFSAVGSNGQAMPVQPANNWQQYSAPTAVYTGSSAPFHFASSTGMMSATSGAAGPYVTGVGDVVTGSPSMGVPRTGAALYPAPIPGIAHQIGGVTIPTQALHPHEMLYPHHYKAMYPPYYYKVNGGWVVTPWGVWSHEDWKLQGTTVDVKYKSYISPWAKFTPPIIR
ncbi:MAG: hypothetical protein R3C19_20080 [Planctomycetaceae bacterium]